MYRQSERTTLEERVDTRPRDADNRTMLRKIADAYFTPKAFEKDGKVYEFLGVKLVQKLVANTTGKRFRNAHCDEIAGTYFIGKRRRTQDLETFAKGTCFNEVVQFPFVALFTYWIGEDIVQHDEIGVAFNGVYLALQVGLVMLQRYNRARVYAAIEHREARDNKYRTANEHWTGA